MYLLVRYSLMNSLNYLRDTPEMSFPSIHKTVDCDQTVHYPVEFLNTLILTGNPLHNLTLKVDAPNIGLRNHGPFRLIIELNCYLIVSNFRT